ncbi:MAG: hypothetical protein KDE27_26870, partial [Planctomycetes bacterium]|nr:hypothetical protein [Planctomycetota bacterium]
MLRHVTIASLLIGTLAAQTTWTSFEDRKGHAIASAPNGGLLMFGGESASSPGTLLDDTNEFTSAATNPLWRRLQPANPPTAREGHAMAAGIGASSLPIFVLFGGLAHGTTTPSGETFLYSRGWGPGPLPATRPSARAGHAMVTDTRRNRVVLFGGYSGGVAMNDVWEFDPVSLVWIPTTITTPMQQLPPPRYGHAMAFDPGTSPTDGRVYVFGGSPFTVNDQLWELQFDAATATAAWTDTMTPLARPSGRRSAAMAYLPAYGNLVLFGGEDSNLVPLGDTWSWNRTSNTWSQRSLATQPSARRDHAMALDAQGNNLVLLGGDDGTGQATRGTWLWNGVDWHQVGAPPPDRNDVAMAYDSARQRHVLFGGRNQANVFGETWELDGVNWIQRFPANTPSPRTEAGMAFDSARNRTVLYGGWDQTHCAAFGETWEWDGSNWLIRITPTTPPNAAGVQPVFDPDRGVTWMLAGADMWRYDGLDWTPALPPSSASAAFAYFPPANAFVLFGGQGPSAGTRNATWQLTGSAWTLRRPTNSPSARRSTAMAFDATTNRLVLFGGFDGSAILGDTWTWDGVTWTQASPATSPPIRADHAMVRDPVRDRIVLFGGNHASNPSLFRNDTWEWNGSSWLAVATATAPSPRSPRLAWDAARDRVVSFGGYAGAGTVLADTWEYDGSDWTQRTPAT